MKFMVIAAMVVGAVLPAQAFHERQTKLPVPSTDKLGVLAKTFYGLDEERRLAYTAGVSDALDLLGIKCPRPAPSYEEIIRETNAYIVRHHDYAESMWAATAIVGAMSERGCKRQ